MNTDESPSTLSLGEPAKRLDLIDSLLRTFDAFVFIQICIGYYLNNSAAFLFLRAISQTFFVSTRPLPVETTSKLPPVLLINSVVIASHLFQENPVAGDGASRGYLHGGVFVDIVGELGPISKWRLLAVDFLIFGVQLLSLAIIFEKHKMKVRNSGPDPTSIVRQDLEAEEEGIRRSAELRPHEDGIELQNLAAGVVQESDANVEISHHLQDKFYTGEGILLELDVIASLRGLMKASGTETVTTATSVDGGMIETVMARMAQRRS